MFRTRFLAVALTIALFTVTGCDGSLVTFIDEGTQYSEMQVLSLATELEPEAAAIRETPSSKASELRHDALVDLRGQGPSASDAASLLTSSFPGDGPGVPFYVELATVDTTPALVILEAIGPADGTLSDTRVWALDLDGGVLLSGTR